MSTTRMQIYVNDTPHEVARGTTLAQAHASLHPEASFAILNTEINPDPGTVLQNQDRLYLYDFRCGEQRTDLAGLIFERQPREATEKLRNACVGIAGAGGLGSVVAENLARAGIGRLVIADHDKVEPSNLNRQRYKLSQLGIAKTAALKENLHQCCPHVDISAVQERIRADNCVRVFSTCAIVCECFDVAESKASLVTALCRRMPECSVIAASGLAGCGTARSITIRRVSDRLYIVGDQHSDAGTGMGLFAPRVGIVASLQSHVALQLILGEQV